MKATIFTILTIGRLTTFATGQVIICDSIVFEEGKSKISESSEKTVVKIPERVKTMEFFDISLTAYLEKPATKQVEQSLAMNRIREICTLLTGQNLGSHISSIEIVSMNGTGKKAIQTGPYRNRVDIIIREQSQPPGKEERDDDEIRVLPAEPDTVITSDMGTQVQIKGGSFYPYKISDYQYEIKELVTADDFINHNVSKTTADQQVIQNARAIRILAMPIYPVPPVPFKLQKPAVILFPCPDSSRRGPLTLFYQAKDQKSFITWKKTRDTTSIKQYGGKKFYKVHVNQLGWAMVGEYVSSCNCSLTIPRFQEQKLSITYPDCGSVFFFENIGDKIINLPCAAGRRGIVISGMAFDQSGQMYSLDLTFSAPEPKKEDILIYKIRKKDYVKL
jgi:hypothetical protein